MDVLRKIQRTVSRNDFRAGVIECLVNICEIDTSLRSDLSGIRHNENRVYEIIATQLETLRALKGRVRRIPISGDIDTHPSFTNPFYAHPQSIGPRWSAADVYRDRSNLLYCTDHNSMQRGRRVAINAHIDTVPPFYPPRLEGHDLFGRGTADDKGNVAAIIAALSILNALVEQDGLVLGNTITAMFVTDEEMGGNGSLALSLDRNLMDRCETLLVLECTGNRIHPGNRGAVNLSCAVELGAAELPLSRISTIESLAYAVLELEQEGFRIKQESDHPLFPHRPVQTCTGIIGPFGDHPSTLCGELSFCLTDLSTNCSRKTVAGILRNGLAAYIATHGNKARSRDPVTGKRKVHHHVDLAQTADGDITVDVHGASGHMGSLLQNDSALTKWAYMTRELVEARLRGELSFTMHLGKTGPRDPLVFEGTQGFLPSHGIPEIMRRTTAALKQGVNHYLGLVGANPEALVCTVDFDKLHNEAFASLLRDETMKCLVTAAERTGLIKEDETLLGWDVSCDARLFAAASPELNVITCGAGSLEFAHSDNERLHLPDLFKFIEFLAYFLVTETGSSIP